VPMSSNTAKMKRFRSMRALMGARLLIALLALPAGSIQLWAQGSNGEILGAVTDQSGGNVAGATVTVIDVARGIPRTLTTDQAGEYVASDLTPGTYTVRVEAKGFKVFEREYDQNKKIIDKIKTKIEYG